MCYICLSKIAGKAKDITHSSITFDKRKRVFQTLIKTQCDLQGQNWSKPKYCKENFPRFIFKGLLSMDFYRNASYGIGLNSLSLQKLSYYY